MIAIQLRTLDDYIISVAALTDAELNESLYVCEKLIERIKQEQEQRRKKREWFAGNRIIDEALG